MGDLHLIYMWNVRPQIRGATRKNHFYCVYVACVENLQTLLTTIFRIEHVHYLREHECVDYMSRTRAFAQIAAKRGTSAAVAVAAIFFAQQCSPCAQMSACVCAIWYAHASRWLLYDNHHQTVQLKNRATAMMTIETTRAHLLYFCSHTTRTVQHLRANPYLNTYRTCNKRERDGATRLPLLAMMTIWCDSDSHTILPTKNIQHIRRF